MKKRRRAFKRARSARNALSMSQTNRNFPSRVAVARVRNNGRGFGVAVTRLQSVSSITQTM